MSFRPGRGGCHRPGLAVEVGGGGPAFHFNGDELVALGEFGDSRFGVGGEAQCPGGDAQQMHSVFIKAQASVARQRQPYKPFKAPGRLKPAQSSLLGDKFALNGMPSCSDSIVVYPIFLYSLSIVRVEETHERGSIHPKKRLPRA